MDILIDSKKFSDFISNNNLFQRTEGNLKKFLKNWWDTDQIGFLEDMNSDIQTVLKKYKFENEGVSLSKSYSYEPPMDYISVWIRIFDEENSYLCEYIAFYDYHLNCFDDKIKG